MKQNRLVLPPCFLLAASPTAHALTSSEIPPGSSKTSPDAPTCGLPEHKSTLADCTDPLDPSAPDHRGNWTDATTGHWQYIEQCADRYTVSGPASEGLYYIHDFPAANGTAEGGVADYIAFAFPECEELPGPVGVFEGECMNMMAGPMAAATRCLLEDGRLNFTNMMIGQMTLTRVVEADDGEAKSPPEEEGREDGGDDAASGAASFDATRTVLTACVAAAASLAAAQ